jgi:4-methoxybenzoate monooxygenase (O-demethylating)
MQQSAEARRPPAGVPVSEIDPFSLEFLADPHPGHEALREAGPVVWLEAYGAYAAARYAEVREILADPATFCSSRGVGLSDFAREKPWRPPSLVLERDPPEHDRARAVLNRALSATVMRALKGRFAEAAESLAAELGRRRRFDAIADCAEVYPMMVLPDAVGLSKEGREHLLPYAATVFNMFGPDNELRRTAVAQMAPHVAWISGQCRRESLSPGGIGAMIHEAADSGEIMRQEAELLVRSLLSAGFDTTVHGIGAAMHALAANPDQLAALRANPGKARAAFEEAVRLESPVQTFFRTTTRDVSLGGVAIPEGEKVLMLLGAANRDPRKWPDPDRYDIDRPTFGHVGFGAGVHMCVGQLLARLEGEALLGALARAFAALEPDGEPTKLYNNTLRGWTRMPMRATPA